jgi:hypothetical protein
VEYGYTDERFPREEETAGEGVGWGWRAVKGSTRKNDGGVREGTRRKRRKVRHVMTL